MANTPEFYDDDDDDLDLDYDGEGDEVNPITLMDFGLCPHGVPEDGECDECCGGISGWDECDPW